MSAKREKAMNDPANENIPAGWHSRGYLPHFDAGQVFQSITFRLADSMPQSLLESWKADLIGESVEIGDKLRIRIEAYLDSGYGACYLSNPQIADIVQDALLYLDGKRYRLSAWVVMPNHVHFLAAPYAEQSLSKIIHSIKSYTSQEANKILLRKGRFWFEDYFDRYIRNARHFQNARSYIESNPVRAGLCRWPEDWLFGSARHRAEKTKQASAGK